MVSWEQRSLNFSDMFDIIAVGSATRDVLIQSEGFAAHGSGSSEKKQDMCFPLGAKIEIKHMVVTTGGGGTNYAVTFARQGLNTACIGVIGNDANGRDLITELQGEGVDVAMFQKHSDDLTAYSVILVHPDGERTILSYKGEGQHFSAAELDFAQLQSKWLFLDSLGGHFDMFEKLVKHAVENNIKIACNPGGKELDHGLAKLAPLLKDMDIFLVNKEEAAKLFGDQDPRQFMPKAVISISDGPRGVVVSDPEGKTYVAGIPDSPVVERTGAGDAFGSGFVAQFIMNNEPRITNSERIVKAIQFGTANASSVVTKFGAKAGILKKSDPDAPAGAGWGPWPLVEVRTN